VLSRPGQEDLRVTGFAGSGPGRRSHDRRVGTKTRQSLVDAFGSYFTQSLFETQEA
jgi:hypothetical protein